MLLAGLAVFFSCSKEQNTDNDTIKVSVGSLQTNEGNCLPSTVVGNYKAGVALTATSYIDVNIKVHTPGRYIIQSDTLNGFSFKGEGAFADTGINTIRLTASGTPVAQAKNIFTIAYGISKCHITVDVVDDNATSAVFTLGTGTNNTCTGAVLAGTYEMGMPLTTANTVSLSVNVTKTGSYYLSVPAVNGISFSKTGIFLTTGVQTVTLTGSGTPSTIGTFIFRPVVNAAGCSFVITVTPRGGVFTCKMDGVFTTFNKSASVTTLITTPTSSTNTFFLQGQMEGSVIQALTVNLDFSDRRVVPVGSYSVDGASSGGYGFGVQFTQYLSNTNASLTKRWNSGAGVAGQANPTPFNFTITSISSDRVTGTFNGKLSDADDKSKIITLTEGAFDVPIRR